MSSALTNPAAQRAEPQLRDPLAGILAGGDVPPSVRDPIGVSSRPATGSGLHPGRLDVPFDPNIRCRGSLVRAAGPVLDQLALDLAGANVAVLLANEWGQVVDRRMSEPWLEGPLDRAGLAPGYVHAEDAGGTSCIGTALAQRGPAVVDSGRHFANTRTTTTACAGAPIHDPGSGRIVGVVDLTRPAGEACPLMLTVATWAAREVEQRLFEDSGFFERLVLQRFVQERRRVKGPLVLITERTMVTNSAADRLVQPDDEPLLRECSEGGAEMSDIVLRSGAAVVVRCQPILDVATTAALLTVTPRDDRRHRDRPTFGWNSLTDTERSVVAVVAEGLTNREAGECLFLSHHTVGFHLRSIFRKLELNSRVELTRLAVEQGLARSD